MAGQPDARTMTARLTYAQVSQRLAGQIETLCHRLLPQGERRQAWWRCGSIAGEPGQSLAVNLAGDYVGHWRDFNQANAHHHGDALDLVAWALFGGDKRQAYHWSLSWLGLADVDPEGFVTQRPAVKAAPPKPKPAADTRGAAQAIFLAAQSDLIDTPVDRYLRGRGDDIRLLLRAPTGSRLRALRFAPALWNVESQRKWPALVAAITAPDGSFAAVHRTWLELLSTGRVRKAPLKAPKMTLGQYVECGGCIRLWRGASNQPFKHAEPGESVMIAEGIEDGLAMVLGAPELRTLAAVSSANRVRVPGGTAEVILIGQNEPKQINDGLWEKVAAHYRTQGLRARVVRPAIAFKDFAEARQWAIAHPHSAA